MEKCNKVCKTRECEYVEVIKFIEYYNQMYNTNYILKQCPDKENGNYTCDLVYEDVDKDEHLYIEVKRVVYGFGNVTGANLLLAVNEGQIFCKACIQYVIEELEDIEKGRELQDFLIIIPLVQLSEGEFNKFIEQLENFLKNQIIDANCKEFCFQYTNGKKIFNIEFIRKNSELKKIDDSELLYLNGNGNSLEEILTSMIDTASLISLLKDNFCKTSEKKFPQEGKNKILLNILKLPNYYEFFFEAVIDSVIREIKKTDFEKEKLNVTQGYLLFFDESFPRKTEGYSVSDFYENALIIINLLGENCDSDMIFHEENGGSVLTNF